jgi:phosphatidylserine decarboxylase
MSTSFKTRLQYLLPQHLLSRFVGWVASSRYYFIKMPFMRIFCYFFEINLNECPRNELKQYQSFNDFFTRTLLPEARPLAQTLCISPVDGVVSESGRIHADLLLQAKDINYSVAKLTGHTELNTVFQRGQFATLYLAPSDYHRIHMPIDATLLEMIYVPGKLFSVQPTTARVVPKLFARNERLVVFFETEIGQMAMVLVGATIVGAIGTAWHGDIQRNTSIKRFNYRDRKSVV